VESGDSCQDNHSNHPGDIPEGTLRAILKQADLSIEEFLKL
jgi:hypothetical protein